MSSLVPEGWEIKPLSDVTHNLDGKRVPLKSTDRALRQGQYRYFGASGVIDYVDDYIFDGEYILLGEDGENVISRVLPLAFKVSGQFWVNNHAHVMQPTSGNDIGYICEFLESLDYSIIASGSAQPKVTQGELKKVKVHIPPLPEQQKIAKILTSVDEVIEKTQAQINKLKDLKIGMMQELLTNGIGHAEFKDSPVGRIPAEWEVKPLSQLALKISDGIHSTPKYTDSLGYYFINGNNLKKGEVIFGKNTKFVSWEEYNKHKKDLGKNTILMSINGTIGNLAYYEGEKVVLGKSAAYISLKEEQSRGFIFYLLQSERIKAFYDLELTGSTIRNLSLRAIKETPIALPSTDEQIEITKILSSFDANIKLKNERLISLQNTKKALMQDLLTGKVRVKTELTNTEVAVG